LEKGGDVYELKGKSGKVWGAALKSTDKSTNPIIISVGHRISLNTALEIIVNCCKTKIPEPIRQADLRSREKVKEIYDSEHYHVKKNF